MAGKKLIAYINAENEAKGSIIRLAEKYNNEGADQLYLYNFDKDDFTRQAFLTVAKEVAHNIDIPIILGLYVNHFEDVKKALYSGASRVVVREELIDNEKAIKEATQRFGTGKVFAEVDAKGEFKNTSVLSRLKKLGIYGVVLKHIVVSNKLKNNISDSDMTFIVRDSLVRNDLAELMNMEHVLGVATNHFEHKILMSAKCALKEQGIDVETYESMLDFSDFKLNSDGMIPVVVQDYKTGEVLMVAYMNEESFRHTLETGKMTYYSRSRQELWCKGDTSGHYQYVKKLMIDCDNDTILAKVRQIGAACHTGNRSCFYRELASRDYVDTNPLTVLTEDYDVIRNRKEHPKEGSYTNYLFDKGIDKILKKCGEEATEMVIAAKNPDAEELKYEIADLLYHTMVLMVECGLDWNDVMKELVNRR